MTKDEALKLALVALEKVTTEMLALKDELAERGARPTTNVFHQRLWDSSFKAYTDHALPAATAIREALAQPEQEPVAMRYDFDGYGYKYIDSGSGSDWKTRIKGAEPLCTTPPQRTWVGLTDEERETATGWSVEHIEDFLKQKNGFAEEKNTWSLSSKP